MIPWLHLKPAPSLMSWGGTLARKRWRRLNAPIPRVVWHVGPTEQKRVLWQGMIQRNEPAAHDAEQAIYTCPQCLQQSEAGRRGVPVASCLESSAC
jgi:hypothetical protein